MISKRSSNRATVETIRFRIELPAMRDYDDVDRDDGQGSTGGGDSFEQELHDSCSSSSTAASEPIYVNTAAYARSRMSALAKSSPQTPKIQQRHRYTGGGQGQTICVDINIDTSGKRKQQLSIRRSPPNCRVIGQSSSSKSSVIKSLRYPASSSCHSSSSSSSSSSGYSSPTKTELNYNLTDELLLETSSRPLPPTEVIYDKLNYVAKGRLTPTVDLLSQQPKRKSSLLTTSTTTREAYEAISDFNSQLNERTRTTAAPPIYEEISCFDRSQSAGPLTTASSKKSCYYEQMSSMKESSVKIQHHHSIYKREYTLNEIFQNIKSFKRQAKEQEMIQVTRLVPPPPPLFSDHIYVNQHISESIEI